MGSRGVFAPVLARHTGHLRLVDVLAVGVDPCAELRVDEEASRGLLAQAGHGYERETNFGEGGCHERRDR